MNLTGTKIKIVPIEAYYSIRIIKYYYTIIQRAY
jgi:hypothetical protein